jgi:hypothetical protein
MVHALMIGFSTKTNSAAGAPDQARRGRKGQVGSSGVGLIEGRQ